MFLKEFDSWVVGFIVWEVKQGPGQFTELRVSGLIWRVFDEHFVVIGYRDPPRVECPVMEFAQSKPIGNDIAAASAFWIDVGSFDFRSPIGSGPVASTDRTAVFIGCTDASPEGCIAYPAALFDELLVLVGQGRRIDGVGYLWFTPNRGLLCCVTAKEHSRQGPLFFTKCTYSLSSDAGEPLYDRTAIVSEPLPDFIDCGDGGRVCFDGVTVATPSFVPQQGASLGTLERSVDTSTGDEDAVVIEQ